MAERILKYDANKDIASLDVREVLSDDQVKV